VGRPGSAAQHQSVRLRLSDGSGAPISFDVATTVAAEGKVRLKRNRKEQTPPGWLLDSEGKPTTDPNDLYNKPEGSILPVGGHKGYSLALMIEVLGGIVARAGYSRENRSRLERPLHGGGDIGRFVSPQNFRSEVDDLIRYIKTSPPIQPGGEILYPESRGQDGGRAAAEGDLHRGRDMGADRPGGARIEGFRPRGLSCCNPAIANDQLRTRPVERSMTRCILLSRVSDLSIGHSVRIIRDVLCELSWFGGGASDGCYMSGLTYVRGRD